MSLEYRRGGTRLTIRRYEPADEGDWLICHALVEWRRHVPSRPVYRGRSVELVAVTDAREVVGFLDAEIETEPGDRCWRAVPDSALVTELGVLKEYRGNGLARRMLASAVQLLRASGVHRLELWATDDAGRTFAERVGCQRIAAYRQLDLRQYTARVERLLRSQGNRSALHIVEVDRLERERSRFSLSGDPLCTGYELTW